MHSLSEGAVELPLSHISVRVAWHDTDWTGRVCASPETNHSCTILKNVKERKDPVAEAQVAGQRWTEIDALPPCVVERAGFMRPKAFTHERTHRYAWNPNGAHAHFATTTQRMPPYSLEVTPYRWVMVGENRRYTEEWGIKQDESLEDRARTLMNFTSAWVQDRRNQLALLDSFFSALQPRKSLLLLYAKDVPLVEEGTPGERYLIGAGFVNGVDPVVEWEYSRTGELRSVMWERGVTHSIRPTFEDGFLLPYHQLLADPALQGADLESFVARTPREHFDEFSYVSELVTHDGAIAAITELARVVDLLPGVVSGPWDQVQAWLTDRLTDVWHARGPYPGMGPMLAAAGIDRGTLLARRVLDELPEGGTDPWPKVEQAVAENLGGLVGRTSRKAFELLVADKARYRQLRIMSRFALTGGQARELFEGLSPTEVIENPYCIYEFSPEEALAFSTIDRGLWPQDADALAALAADPIDEPVSEPSDDRRVRAASMHLLEEAAEEGHTLLDEAGLRRRLSQLEVEPKCNPVDVAFEIAARSFSPLLQERELAREAGRGWQLDRLAAVSDGIRADVRARLEGLALDVSWNWADRIEQVLPAVDEPDTAELEARAEKAAALEVIVRKRISTLIGPAGTGKTSMLEALCADPSVKAGGILLLAPTGKAAVQLAYRTKLPAKNLAQFLRKYERWDWESGTYYLAPKAPRFQGAKTVIIDEASMLTEEMLAATIDALADVDRLILCGDPRQLPPIGAGRPFADLVALLRDDPGTGGGVAELRTSRRQAAAAHSATTLDDVDVASLFSLDAEALGADEALSRVLEGNGDGRVEIISWDDEADLHRKVVETLGLPRFPWGSAGHGAENWQLLSPVRARPGGVVGLNELVRRTWRGEDVQMASRARKMTSPMGADQVIFADKVMVLRNDHNRKGKVPGTWDKVPRGVANGEIGLVVNRPVSKGKPAGHTLELSTQPGLQFDFWESELNGDSEGQGEWLGLAYAVTVHKSQGSQFKVTFVVIPDPCSLLSPELLYTALTRQQDRVVLLKQGDLSTLRDLASPSRSETGRRLTCLFRPADPFALGDGTVLDGNHVHRTARGDDLVRSKSEVIVADALHDLGLPYRYEAPLAFPGELPRHPDFTIHQPGSRPVYWEHLGMLDLAGYRADWEARKAWYASHEILPWDDGGGPAGMLVWSDENVSAHGIDSSAVRELARNVFDLK
jgi:AAA domain/UvrD-like helicase C-terminal domain